MKKIRPTRKTLWGMPLAPSPPYPRTFHKISTQKKAKKLTREEKKARSQGLALLMVLTLLVLATTITMELQFDARVQLQLAANSRDALQAEYLARSALAFTHLLLAFNSQFQKMKDQLKRNPALKTVIQSQPQIAAMLNRLQIWKIVPLNSDLLKQIARGEFGREPPKENEKKDTGRLYPFGEFSGRFSATLTDESSKINLNHFDQYSDAQKLALELTNLFAPKKYDPLFERTRENGSAITRKEQIAAFADWRDRNNIVFGESGTTEDSKYRYSEKGYFSKNGPLYSVDEIRLIYGVDDLFFQTFGEYFTVFGKVQQINVNNAPEEVLRALIQGAAILKPHELTRFFQPEFQIFMRQVMMYRDYIGFSDLQNFIQFIKNPQPLDPRIYPFVANGGAGLNYAQRVQGFNLNVGKIAHLLFHASTFKVVAVGQVGRVERRITAVIHVQPRGKRDTQYWRLH